MASGWTAGLRVAELRVQIANCSSDCRSLRTQALGWSIFWPVEQTIDYTRGNSKTRGRPTANYWKCACRCDVCKASSENRSDVITALSEDFCSGNIERFNNKCTRHDPVDSMTRLKWSFHIFFIKLPGADMGMKHALRLASPLYIKNITRVSSAVILTPAIWATLANTWQPGNKQCDSLSHT